MISARGVTKRYGDQAALEAVDLEVPPGSVYGLIGPNGAGKTTLLSILAGLRSPTEGEVQIAVPENSRAFLPDAPRFEKWLTGREVVSLAAKLAGGGDEAAVDRMLGTAGLSDAADRTAGGYSRGMLQRLGLAATLVGGPELVLLDEPAAALDPSGRREVLDLVNRMRGTATVVFSSHILADVQAVSDRVGILDGGTLLFDGTVDELLSRVAGTAYVVRLREGASVAAAALRRLEWVEAVTEPAAGTLRISVTSFDVAERELIPTLAALPTRVVSVEPEPVTLERAFLEVTG